MRFDSLIMRDDTLLESLRMPELQTDLLPDRPPENRPGRSSREPAQNSQDYGLELPQYNPLLD
jgi:hypothetical protein